MKLELVDVQSFLRLLGIRNIKEDGQEVQYSCPFPGHNHGDKNPSASMQQGTTVAHCFGCGWSGNAVSFLAELEGVSPLKATQWLREEFGDGFKDPDESFSREINEVLNSYANVPKLLEERIPILNESEVQKRSIDWCSHSLDSSGPTSYFIDRGFLPETLMEYEIGWDEISQRFTIPIRDELGNLIGFKARALPGVEPRYLVLGGPEYGFEPYQTARVVFGLDKAIKYKPAWEEEYCLVVCEGELNSIAYHQKIGMNSVGISGKHLSQEQVRLIVNNCRCAILFFDEIEDAISAARKLEPYIPVKIIPEHNKDAADLEAREIFTLLGNSTPSLLL